MLCLTLALALAAAHATEVKLTRVPNKGLQPQALLDPDGSVHLVYFKGDPNAGDLFYVRRSLDSNEFSPPIRVNSKSGSAIAIGTIRGPQIALGKYSRLHVAWNGSGKASGHDGVPMLYTRWQRESKTFERERDVMTFTSALDGGGSVAADEQGNVYVAWHGQARKEGNEATRAVFVAISKDEGQTFAKERQAISDLTGACGCCGMKAFADSQGQVYLLFRAAREGVERGETLLVSKDQGVTFSAMYSHPWRATICPMSSAWLGAAPGSVVAAWETMGRVWFAAIDPRTREISNPVGPRRENAQKHPLAVTNRRGETLLVWTEGTGWQKGGAVVWQVFDRDNNPTSTEGRQDGVPIWSLAAALPRPDGSFEILY